MSEWISVEDRLPDLFEVVLVSNYFPFPLTAQLEPARTWLGQWPNNSVCNGAQHLQGVTHWMPLPEPPDEDITPTPEVEDE